MKIKVCIISLFFLFSCTENDAKLNIVLPKKVEITPSLINLGKISKSEQTELKFKLVNQNQERIKVEKISKSCGCTDIRMNSNIIYPDSSKEVSIIFNPKDDSGDVTKKVVFRLSNKQFLTFTFQAFVI